MPNQWSFLYYPPGFSYHLFWNPTTATAICSKILFSKFHSSVHPKLRFPKNMKFQNTKLHQHTKKKNTRRKNINLLLSTKRKKLNTKKRLRQLRKRSLTSKNNFVLVEKIWLRTPYYTEIKWYFETVLKRYSKVIQREWNGEKNRIYYL